MTRLIPLLRDLEQSRRVLAEYLSEGHPHLQDLVRDLPRSQMVPIDVVVAGRLTETVATLDDDTVQALLADVMMAAMLRYRAGLAFTSDLGEYFRMSDTASELMANAVVDLASLLGVRAPFGQLDVDVELAAIDRVARQREDAADRRELAAAA